MNRDEIALKIFCARVGDVNYLAATDKYVQQEVCNSYRMADLFLNHPNEKQYGEESKQP